MLEKVDLTRAISKEEYKSRLPVLQERLYNLQLAASETGLASVSPVGSSRAPFGCT